MWYLWFIKDIFQRLFLLKNWESAGNVNEVGIIFVGKGTECHSFFKVYPPPHLAEQIFCESEIVVYLSQEHHKSATKFYSLLF